MNYFSCAAAWITAKYVLKHTVQRMKQTTAILISQSSIDTSKMATVAAIQPMLAYLEVSATQHRGIYVSVNKQKNSSAVLLNCINPSNSTLGPFVQKLVKHS